jgi:hypothetical protein
MIPGEKKFESRAQQPDLDDQENGDEQHRSGNCRQNAILRSAARPNPPNKIPEVRLLFITVLAASERQQVLELDHYVEVDQHLVLAQIREPYATAL